LGLAREVSRGDAPRNMSEPLSDEDVRRIARQTAREIVKRVFDLGLLIVATLVALMMLPALVVGTVNSFSPPLALAPNPVAGAILAVTFVIVIVILARSWSILMRDR
jgi:hypothetical protein